MRTRNGRVRPLVSKNDERPLVQQFFSVDEALHANHLNFQKEGPPGWHYPIKREFVIQVREIEPPASYPGACFPVSWVIASSQIFGMSVKEVEERFSHEGHLSGADTQYYTDNTRLCEDGLVFCGSFDLLDFLFGDPI